MFVSRASRNPAVSGLPKILRLFYPVLGFYRATASGSLSKHHHDAASSHRLDNVHGNTAADNTTGFTTSSSGRDAS